VRHHQRVSAREATREQSLAGLLDAVVASELDAWSLRFQGEGAAADPAWSDGLRLLAAALSREWTAALTLDRASDAPGDADHPARWLRRGARAWASSGDPSAGSSQGLADLLADLPDLGCGASARFAAYLYVEGALAHGRLDLADTIARSYGEQLWGPLVLEGRAHPFGAVLGLCRARLLAFRGEVAAADEVHRALPPPEAPTLRAVWAATGSLVRGNDADPGEVRRLAKVVADLAGGPRDHLTAGAHLLVAFGLVAVGDVSAAVTSLLLAGRDADLGGCNVIDRALGLELLVALAVAEGDLDAAAAWRDRAAPLLASPMADSTVARIHSRVLLHEGRAAEAIAWAELAVERAEAGARGIEAAEGRIVLNRARLANRGSDDRRAAQAALREMVTASEALGHGAARRAAARELRPFGLRLPPLSGSGWGGLSTREAEVARWVAQGATNRQVAQRLHVSEHTVRAHVSRILAAFAVATRSGLPAAMGADPAGPELAAGTPGPHAALTPRQEDVVRLVAAGVSNREVADRLALSVRTVERHVSDILQRWSLPSRTALALAVRERTASGSPTVEPTAEPTV
jgi:DNA-binding NarL/FixJ family response regulator